MRKFGAKTIAALIAVIMGCGLLIWLFGNGFDIAADNIRKAEISKIENPEVSQIKDGKIVPQPLRIIFSENVAAARLLGDKIDKGIKMHPALKGVWKFDKASVLTFVPEKDWLPGSRYEVVLHKDILAPGIELKDYDFEFDAPKFAGKNIEAEFYEDPRNRRNKSAVAGFEFSYPLREDSIKQAVSVTGIDGKKYDFSYKLADDNRRLYVLSQPLPITDKENFVIIRVGDVKNSYNDKPAVGSVEAKVKIPAIASFFNIKSIKTQIVTDKKTGNPRQVLGIEFTSQVEKGKLADYLQVFYSEETCGKLREMLAKSGNNRSAVKSLTPLKLQEAKQVNPDSRLYEFYYQLPERGQCLLAVVNKGLSSVDGFMLKSDAMQLLPAADYPLEAKLAYSGAVVPLKGTPRLEFAARGVKELQVKLARIERDDLNNLVTQTGGQFASPYFLNYNFNEYNMAQVFEKKIPLNMTNPAEMNYASLDLKPYLGRQKGIFIVLLKGMYNQDTFSPEDRRLVVVTDLGVVVKDNLDKSHDVFVASLSAEKPVAGAKVEILGKNGLSIAEALTDETGHVKMPDVSGFEYEKQPVAYKVSLGDDMSYLPFDRYDLRVNYSRFAVEGVYVPEDNAEGLMAEIFSDRGVYRPGEKAHFGIILRQNNLDVPQNLPLEAEIINPRGEQVSTGLIKVIESGLTEYEYDIPETSTTGYYHLTLYRQDKDKNKFYVASTSFRVEEFEPDSMKLKLEFVDVPKGWVNDADVKVKALLTNLYGNPAVGHAVKVSYLLTQSSFYFEKYNQFTFANPLKAEKNSVVKVQKEQLPEQKTDETGRALFEIDLAKYTKGTYLLKVYADGMEAGSGRGVSAQKSLLIAPQKYLIGYQADGALHNIAREAKRSLKFIAINPDLEKIAKTDLKLSLKKREYLSNLVEMPNGTYKYQVTPQEKQVKEEIVDIALKGTDVLLDTHEAGEFILYLFDGEDVAAKVEYSVDAAANEVMAIDKDAGLVVKLDKDEYAPGEIIKAEIAAPYEGYGLVTIERDSVYAYKWFKADGKTAKVSLTLPAEVEGNAYVNAAWFRSLKSEEIFRSPLSYAVVPFTINRTVRELVPQINLPQTVRPGDKLVIKYKTKVPAQMIIWGVNEGILQIADYKTPAPLDFFLRKKALRVITAQIMDMIMPTMQLAQFIKAPGGGMESSMVRAKMLGAAAADMAMNMNPFARKLNKIAAFWSGIVTADTDEKEFVYNVPETFSGQMRIMAVAVNAKQFGHVEKDVLVRGDFVIRPSGPFSAAPGDEFVIGVGIANLVEKSGNDYKIRLKAEVKQGGLEILGDKEKLITLKEGGEEIVNFRAKALDQLGAAEIYFSAEAVVDKTKKAAMPYYIGIRPAVAYMTDLQFGYRTKELTLKDFVIKMYPQDKEQNLTASTSPLVLAGGLLQYLNKFEHPCTEQTVSKIYPVIELMFKHPELVNSEEVYKKFDEAMQILTERQQLDGGFSFWPSGKMAVNEDVSLYATEFLVAAYNRGMNVPQNLLNQALNFTRGVAAKKPQNPTDIRPAQAAYILTKAGEITTNYLLNLERELVAQNPKEWKNSLSAAYLAAGYQMLQNQTKAGAVLGRYKFGGNKLDDLRYLYLMAENFPKIFADNQKQNIEVLLSPLEEGYYNTWSSAYSILTMNVFAGKPEDDTKIVFDGHEAEYELFARLQLDDTDKKLEVKSPQPFFYSLNQQGYPQGKITKPESKGIEISKQLLDKNGQPVTKVKLGDEIEVVLKMRSLTGYDIFDTAVVDLLPGGTDIVRKSINADTLIDFSQEKEDRMNVYTTLPPAGQTIRYKIKAVSRGRFAVPPAYAAAMYDILLKGHSVTTALEIE